MPTKNTQPPEQPAVTSGETSPVSAQVEINVTPTDESVEIAEQLKFDYPITVVPRYGRMVNVNTNQPFDIGNPVKVHEFDGWVISQIAAGKLVNSDTGEQFSVSEVATLARLNKGQ